MTDNPLSKLYRHKSIYIQLPSKGKYYTSGINLSIDNDLGIMPMTAYDEISLKSPDALFNGDGLINLIKSCVPDIKNPEEMPSCDIDPIIIGIRAASNKILETEVECPHCKTEQIFNLDLTMLLSTFKEISENNIIELSGNTIIKVRPYSLRSQLKTNIQTFHQIRMEMILNNNESITDDKKLELFNSAFAEATKLTVELVADNILAVELDDLIVTDKEHIFEWVQNMDKQTYKTIVEKIKELSNGTMEKTTKVQCSNAECNKVFETIIDLNPVSFFT
jgi:hypothetical protein